MPKIFFTSDSHFYHRNIIKYCNRPFSSMEEMNEAMIEKWNKKVGPNDTVYHLGDFTFGNVEELLLRLNGNKIFTTGDHDKELEELSKKNTFESLYSTYKTIIYNKQVLKVLHNNEPILCLHWCLRVWPLSHYNSLHLYGHSHGKVESIGRSMDVGVDCNNFEPISINEVMEIMKSKPDNPNLIKDAEK